MLECRSVLHTLLPARAGLIPGTNHQMPPLPVSGLCDTHINPSNSLPRGSERCVHLSQLGGRLTLAGLGAAGEGRRNLQGLLR